MSQVFFDELEIPTPDYHLNAGSGTHAEQTAKIMIAFEKVCADERTGVVVVVGDVNSTLACSITAHATNVISTVSGFRFPFSCSRLWVTKNPFTSGKTPRLSAPAAVASNVFVPDCETVPISFTMRTLSSAAAGA